MGLLKAMFLRPMDVQADLDRHKRKMAAVQRQVTTANQSVTALAALQKENYELRLHLAALIQLLGSKGIMAPHEIRHAVYTLDQEDGKINGQYRGKLV